MYIGPIHPNKFLPYLSSASLPSSSLPPSSAPLPPPPSQYAMKRDQKKAARSALSSIPPPPSFSLPICADVPDNNNSTSVQDKLPRYVRPDKIVGIVDKGTVGGGGGEKEKAKEKGEEREKEGGEGEGSSSGRGKADLFHHPNMREKQVSLPPLPPPHLLFSSPPLIYPSLPSYIEYSCPLLPPLPLPYRSS